MGCWDGHERCCSLLCLRLQATFRQSSQRWCRLIRIVHCKPSCCIRRVAICLTFSLPRFLEPLCPPSLRRLTFSSSHGGSFHHFLTPSLLLQLPHNSHLLIVYVAASTFSRHQQQLVTSITSSTRLALAVVVMSRRPGLKEDEKKRRLLELFHETVSYTTGAIPLPPVSSASRSPCSAHALTARSLVVPHCRCRWCRAEECVQPERARDGRQQAERNQSATAQQPR